jgi:phage terminase large subunit-like protein
MATTEITVQLHKPHPKQAEVKQSKATRKVIVAGRRVGKTTVVSDIAAEGLLQGRRVLEAAPTAEQTDAFWDMCKLAFAEPIAAGLIYKNETLRLLECRLTGGRIRTKTAYNADTLRGDHADLLILDEYSLMDPSAWDEVGAPMLLDNNGDAIFIFTPKRRNHAYHMYNRPLATIQGVGKRGTLRVLRTPI